MKKTADWPSIVTAKALIVGEHSTLQWKDEIIEYAMFLDYYFNSAPYDLGERSRYSEAKTIFELISEITAKQCRAQEVYGTLLTNEFLSRPPKGKHILVPEKEAQSGIRHIKKILKENPSIEYVFVMGMQANYHLQNCGFYSCDELTPLFLKGAEPRRKGLNDEIPYYQPVDAKPFRKICFGRYKAKEESVVVIPILPIKSYPLAGAELEHFGQNFEALKESFKK